jgi:hypothetical protein
MIILCACFLFSGCGYYREAYDDGYEDGYEDGYDEGQFISTYQADYESGYFDGLCDMSDEISEDIEAAFDEIYRGYGLSPDEAATIICDYFMSGSSSKMDNAANALYDFVVEMNKIAYNYS